VQNVAFKLQAAAEKTAKNVRGLLYVAAPCRSFRRRVFPVNHLHWYWQPNQNNQEGEHK